jgi:ribosomal protein S18 acetylase RimI-like enzyme
MKTFGSPLAPTANPGPEALAPDAPLVPFQLAFADLVCQWAQVSTFSPWTSPPSVQELGAAIADPYVAPYLLFERQRPVAYGEIWSELLPREIELARVIVHPDERRRGVGTALMRRLIATVRERYGAPIWVRVLPGNTPALACYAKLGFVRASPEDELRFNEEGQSPGMRWLQLSR